MRRVKITNEKAAMRNRASKNDPIRDAYFHEWTRDADGEPSAIVEYDDGSVDLVWATAIVFLDRV